MPLGRVLRLIRLATEIKANPSTTPESLSQRLGVSRSQFYKDREGLKRLGFEFRFSRKENRIQITHDAFLPAQDLTFPERFALVLAVRQFLAFGEYSLGGDALSAVRKLISQAPDPQAAFLRETLGEAVLREGFGCKPEVLAALQEAMSKRRRVVLQHRSIREGRVKTWTVDPCALLFRRRAFYLDGYVLEAREYRMFRASRVESVKILPIQIPAREDYSFTRRHGSAFSVFPGETRTPVRVKFDGSVAPFIREVLWHPSQSLKDLSDGGVLLQVEVAEPREVGWWALQWGAGAEILAPEGLRGEMAREAGLLYQRYAKAAAEEEPLERVAEEATPYPQRPKKRPGAGSRRRG
ncbi:MAG: helix-turn-helix transcriptional regulator [Nitrospinota bacterium]